MDRVLSVVHVHAHVQIYVYVGNIKTRGTAVYVHWKLVSQPFNTDTVYDSQQRASGMSVTYTVNSLIFARDLFGEINDHLQIAKINIQKHISCTYIINKT